MGAGDGEKREWPGIVQLLHPGIELCGREDGEKGAVGDVHDGEIKILFIAFIVITGNALHHGRLARWARHVRLIAPVAGPEGQPENLPAGGIGSPDIGLHSPEGVEVDGDVAVVVRLMVGAGQQAVGGEVGGVDEAGDAAGDIGYDVAGADLLALEALDGDELEGGDCEVADGEVGHCE